MGQKNFTTKVSMVETVNNLREGWYGSLKQSSNANNIFLDGDNIKGPVDCSWLYEHTQDGECKIHTIL
jgi:hypothetical protein